MQTSVQKIKEHLKETKKYEQPYIDRVVKYMEAHPDIADEFAGTLPKKPFPTTCIHIAGVTAPILGARTMLTRSAIYVVLARLREEPKKTLESIQQEEKDYLCEHLRNQNMKRLLQ